MQVTKQQKHKYFHVGRGLFRLWLVATVIWILAIFFAFWLGNGGAGARWVWNDESSIAYAPRFIPEDIPNFRDCASEAPRACSREKRSMSWEEFANQPAPPVVIAQQIPAYLFLALLLPAVMLAFGASVAWAIKGFQP
jgi:hypothetical protein